ncbi:aspartate/glutamate racemase family protein [Bacillus suaedaesalsae]|uniref:Aspartate/glutamate racemase family protein n=1 Tax=Bacillus suaedaesalsae TaxID=2810349 RepID=A0ABS2DHR3_9BACI|nr:aspartate/glutamate racemase family protein [Bacillus suaedaesalsae]MBM6617988.1 aspartate/glutamate racemase family protein [Bacillus suaedaesalsae]
MKTIGLIGGMSWESSAEYYRIVNEEVKRKLGGLHSANCILYSVDFAEIQRYQLEGEWNRAGEVLANAAYSLQLAGADCVVICTNTMHKVSDVIEQKINIPLLHIADTIAKQINESGLKKVGLLGTKYTMEQDFYTSRLQLNGIDSVIPKLEEREIINQIIFEELCLGIIKESSREYYLKVINRLVDEGAEGIILGCTEIGLLVKQKHTDIPLFDTTMIHAIEAVNHAFRQNE